MANMPKYKVDHYQQKIGRHFNPLIEEQELLVKQYRTEATKRIVGKLSKKMGADKILASFKKAEEMIEYVSKIKKQGRLTDEISKSPAEARQAQRLELVKRNYRQCWHMEVAIAFTIVNHGLLIKFTRKAAKSSTTR